MKNYKKIIVIVVIILLVGCVGALVGKGSLRTTRNQNSEIISYTDDTKKYITNMEMSYEIESAESYSYDIELEPEKKHRFYITNNTLSDNVDIVIRDSKGSILYDGAIESCKADFCLGDKEYISGKYSYEIKLKKKCKGSLEISFNE